MPAMTLEQAQRLALQRGAKLTHGGKVFNASRDVIPNLPAKAAPAEAPAPVPAPAPEPVAAAPELQGPDFSMLIADAEARLDARLDAMRDVMIEMAPAAPAVQAPTPRQVPVSWEFKVDYDAAGKVAAMRAVPSEELADAAAPANWRFAVQYDRQGAITTVSASKT